MVPRKVVYTMRKVKSVFSSLKTPVEKLLEAEFYIRLHIQVAIRGMSGIKEHCRKVTPLSSRFTSFNHTLEMDDVGILAMQLCTICCTLNDFRSVVDKLD